MRTTWRTDRSYRTSRWLPRTTELVAALGGASGVRLLEVDEDTEASGRGHIAGALGVHCRNDLQDLFGETSSAPRR